MAPFLLEPHFNVLRTDRSLSVLYKVLSDWVYKLLAEEAKTEPLGEYFLFFLMQCFQWYQYAFGGYFLQTLHWSLKSKDGSRVIIIKTKTYSGKYFIFQNILRSHVTIQQMLNKRKHVIFIPFQSKKCDQSEAVASALMTLCAPVSVVVQSSPCCPSDGAAALRHQVDEGVAGLCQLSDGDSASLSDELSHRVQLLWSDEDELPSVVDHACSNTDSDFRRWRCAVVGWGNSSDWNPAGTARAVN